MSNPESERPMQGNTIPEPVGDEIITYRGRMIEVVTQQMRVGSEEIVYEKARRSPVDIVTLMKLISQAATE